ncbi:alpha/beta fold hydrolase [Streptosporangium fragile]|uniref:Alpha/beta fold hydrolase n=1 Tax=Streptosporangium fragile TaxID=46186 RepID=A0ABN3W0N1_9ACTN
MGDLDPRWFRRHRALPGAAGRIVCFAPAGASANFFRGWAGHAPADVEVTSVAYPGRERRFDEPEIEDMGVLADSVANLLAPHLDLPTVLFGHSMGASVAFEVTRRLEEAGGDPPIGLVVSGRESPRHQIEEPTDVGEFDDEQIVEYLRVLGGTPPEVLADPDFRELVLPAFRTDFRLLGRYRPEPEPRVRTPVAVVLGDRDPEVDAADADRWREVAHCFTGVRDFPGGHFYLVEREADVVAHVVGFLLAQRSRAWSGSLAR